MVCVDLDGCKTLGNDNDVRIGMERTSKGSERRVGGP